MTTENRTYKLRIPNCEHALYFTVAGTPVPTMLFVNCKDMRSFEWLTALMTAYSRQLRAGVLVSDIIGDMSETFDPHGGYMIPDGSGRKAHSLIHHLGLILEQHIDEIRYDSA